LDLAREHRDRAILADVEPRADRVSEAAVPSRLAGLLLVEREAIAHHDQDRHARADGAQELPAAEREAVARRLSQLVAVGFERVDDAGRDDVRRSALAGAAFADAIRAVDAGGPIRGGARCP